MGGRVLGDGSAGPGAPVSSGTSATPFPPVSSQLHLGSGSQSRLRSLPNRVDRLAIWDRPGKEQNLAVFFFSSFVIIFLKSKFAQFGEIRDNSKFQMDIVPKRKPAWSSNAVFLHWGLGTTCIRITRGFTTSSARLAIL